MHESLLFFHLPMNNRTCLSVMATLIEPLEERTSKTLTASVLYPDVASIAQAFVENAIKNSPKSYIELRIDFAPVWKIECSDDGIRDGSIDDDSIQSLSFLGTLCTDTCGERMIRKVCDVASACLVE